MKKPREISGKNWDTVTNLRNKPENKSFSLKVPGQNFKQEKSCGRPSRQISNAGRNAGYVPKYSNKATRNYRSNYLRSRKSEDLVPYLELKGLYFFRSADGCWEYVVRTPDFTPNYPQWWNDYPSNLFEIITPPFWRNWQDNWIMPPESINPFINGRPEEEDTIPEIQLPSGSSETSGSSGSSGSSSSLAPGESEVIQETYNPYPEGTIDVLFFSPATSARWRIGIEDMINFSGYLFAGSVISNQPSTLFNLQSDPIPNESDIGGRPRLSFYVESRDDIDLASPAYVQAFWNNVKVFDSVERYGAGNWMKDINGPYIRWPVIFVPTDLGLIPLDAPKLKFRFQSSRNIWNFHPLWIIVRNLTGEVIGYVEQGDLEVSDTLYEFEWSLPTNEVLIELYSDQEGFGIDLFNASDIFTFSLNDEVFFDAKISINDHDYSDFVVNDWIDNFSNMAILVGGQAKNTGTIVTYYYQQANSSTNAGEITNLRLGSNSKVVIQEINPDSYEDQFGYTPEVYEVLQTLPGKNNINGNHFVGSGVQNCVYYPDDVQPLLQEDSPEYCDSGYGGGDQVYLFQIVNADNEDIYHSQVECCAPVWFVAGEAPQVQTIYTCSCPDWSRYTSYNQQLQRGSVKLRNWKASNAGSTGDCKHIMATKRLLGLELPLFSDVPEIVEEGPDYTEPPALPR